MDKKKLKALQGEFVEDTIRIKKDKQGDLRYFRPEDNREYTYQNPYILELEITRRCNLKCIHCYAESENIDFAKELSFNEIRQLLQQAKQLGIEELSLTGGEVLVHPQFIEIVDLAFQMGFNLRFVSNGVLFSDKLIEQLCQKPIKLITISLDAINPQIHEKIRGKGTHKKTLDNILKLSQIGFNVSIITAFSTVNFNEFSAIYQFCLKNDLDWQVQMTSAKGRAKKHLILSPDQYYQLGKQTIAIIMEQPGINIIPMDDLATFSNFFPLNQLSSTWQGKCTGGLLNIFVRANGDVTPCSALAFPENVVGNFRNQSLVDICNQELCRKNLNWLSHHTRTGTCKDCKWWTKCQGGCPDILIANCPHLGENIYCYHHIEQNRILESFCDDEI
ncbi:MAG: radical SAM protein [Deltaproteobacteria bacterium]|nr:radical SAM protein [Deltaproteobacteria bacterium]